MKPLRTHLVASNIFTSPEIATVGVTEKEIAEGKYQADTVMLPLTTNARAKMMAMKDGFVKIFSRKHSGTVIEEERQHLYNQFQNGHSVPEQTSGNHWL